MDQVREVLRYHHYAIRTEDAYVRWILAFIRFNGCKHPRDMGKAEIEAFLSDLAVNGNCARSIQNQALNSVVFLYKQVLDLPVANALARKYPNAPRSWEWQYVFPAQNLSTDPRSGQTRRHHLNESNLQKAVKKARTEAGISKRVTSHTFRHSFATHLLESGTNIRVVQKLLGHADVKTTEIYTHVLQQNLAAVRSPLDDLSL